MFSDQTRLITGGTGCLLTQEELAAAEDLGEYYCIPPDGRDLNYAKFVEQRERSITLGEDYNSHNTRRLNREEMKTLLLKLEFMRRLVNGEPAVAEA